MSVVCPVPKTSNDLVGNLVVVATSSGKNYLGRDLSVLTGEEQKGQGVFKNIFAYLEKTGGACITGDEGRFQLLAQTIENEFNPTPLEVEASPTLKRKKVDELDGLHETLSNLFLEQNFLDEMNQFADYLFFSFYGEFLRGINGEQERLLKTQDAIIAQDPWIDAFVPQTDECRAFIQSNCGWITDPEAPDEVRNRRLFSSQHIDKFINGYNDANEEVQKIIKTILPRLIRGETNRKILDLSSVLGDIAKTISNLQYTHSYLHKACELVTKYVAHLKSDQNSHRFSKDDLEYYQRMKSVVAAYRKDVESRIELGKEAHEKISNGIAIEDEVEDDEAEHYTRDPQGVDEIPNPETLSDFDLSHAEILQRRYAFLREILV